MSETSGDAEVTRNAGLPTGAEAHIADGMRVCRYLRSDRATTTDHIIFVGRWALLGTLTCAAHVLGKRLVLEMRDVPRQQLQAKRIGSSCGGVAAGKVIGPRKG